MSFLLACPLCGPRDVYEFRFGGEVQQRPSPGSSQAAWGEYLYGRTNIEGVERAWWFHRRVAALVPGRARHARQPGDRDRVGLPRRRLCRSDRDRPRGGRGGGGWRGRGDRNPVTRLRGRPNQGPPLMAGRPRTSRGRVVDGRRHRGQPGPGASASPRRPTPRCAGRRTIASALAADGVEGGGGQRRWRMRPGATSSKPPPPRHPDARGRTEYRAECWCVRTSAPSAASAEAGGEEADRAHRLPRSATFMPSAAEGEADRRAWLPPAGHRRLTRPRLVSVGSASTAFPVPPSRPTPGPVAVPAAAAPVRRPVRGRERRAASTPSASRGCRACRARPGTSAGSPSDGTTTRVRRRRCSCACRGSRPRSSVRGPGAGRFWISPPKRNS